MYMYQKCDANADLLLLYKTYFFFLGFLIHAMAIMLALSFLLLSQNRRKAFPCSTVVTIKTYFKVKVP